MLFEHRAFWLPKDVQDVGAYEDAFDVDGARGMAAVCDGVASSIFSGRWADILAKAVVAEPPDVNDRASVEAWLKHARDKWSRSIDENALAWHQKPKMLDGAGTTLLWVQVAATAAPDGVPRPYCVWSFSIGDCCFFHVRGNDVLQTFPIQESARFEDNPLVIRSVYKKSDVVAFEAIETQCNPGDLLVLCTDAVAAWTMRQLESGTTLDWQSYWGMSNEQWCQWMVQLRQENQIRYDDSTALLLRVGGAGPAPRKASVEEDSLLDAAETKIRGALKSLKGSLRKGLRDISDSKWLDDKNSK
jgi:serine/threonine protein phosphatase PrpC